MLLIATFVALVFAYSLVSRRLQRTVITGPIVFTTVGALMGFSPEVTTALSLDRQAFLLVAELGLVMTLFTDASRIGLQMLKGRTNLPLRLLSTGMLLTIVLGASLAMVLLGKLAWWEAGILAAILAPTDAGLGQVIVSSPDVPSKIRQALNIEAGLNDGLAVPFLMFFIALAAAEQQGAGSASVLSHFLVEQLGYGALVGLGVGLAGGCLIGLARRRQWMDAAQTQLGVVALPLACVLAAHASGASMFIAAFIAGLATQVGFRKVGQHSIEFTEDWGQLLNNFVFFLFGLLVAQAWSQFSVMILLYAVLSLTLIRMLPVALALRGAGLQPSTVLFMGWFGPRGLASIVLGLFYLENAVSLPGEPTIRLAVMATVMLSIFAHGLSTLPGIRRYAAALAPLGPTAAERLADTETDKRAA